MKALRFLAIPVLTASCLVLPLSGLADETNSPATPSTPPRPDKLTTCPVSGEKLGEMGKPYVFVYNGQEVKLCCPGCRKDFDKTPEKYMKKIREADQPAKSKPAEDTK
jgi:YHS domain-containing protein